MSNRAELVFERWDRDCLFQPLLPVGRSHCLFISNTRKAKDRKFSSNDTNPRAE